MKVQPHRLLGKLADLRRAESGRTPPEFKMWPSCDCAYQACVLERGGALPLLVHARNERADHR